MTHFGKYQVVRGKLSHDDARSAYVLGPTLTGRIAPLASFWCYEEALQWAKDRAAERAAEEGPTDTPGTPKETDD